LQLVEDRILAMESVSEVGRSWVLKSLEGSVSSTNLDTTEGRKHNSATVADLEYYYLKSVVTKDLPGTKQYLSKRIKGYPGIRVDVTEVARTLCRRLGKSQFILRTQDTGKYQQNREHR
jgi:hypothetical protein